MSWLRKRKTFRKFEECSPPITISHTRACTKKFKNHSIHGIIASTFHWLIQLNERSFPISFYTIPVYSIAKWFSQSPTTVLSGLDTGPDSVTLTVEDLVQEKILSWISSQKNLLAAWSFLVAHRQGFLNKHLAGVPTTRNREGTMEIRDQFLSSVGAQEKDTNGCLLSYLEDFEFHWENPDLNKDAVLRPGIDTPSPLPSFRFFELGSMA